MLACLGPRIVVLAGAGVEGTGGQLFLPGEDVRGKALDDFGLVLSLIR
jgi:hypothetical protein